MATAPSSSAMSGPLARRVRATASQRRHQLGDSSATAISKSIRGGGGLGPWRRAVHVLSVPTSLWPSAIRALSSANAQSRQRVRVAIVLRPTLGCWHWRCAADAMQLSCNPAHGRWMLGSREKEWRTHRQLVAQAGGSTWRFYKGAAAGNALCHGCGASASSVVGAAHLSTYE